MSTPANGLALQHVTPPLAWENFRVAAFDMDSTLINIECIDEIAAVAGKKAEVAAITEAAMRGEITDFRDSLSRRLALLAGLDASALATVLHERLRLNPGAETLLAALRQRGIRTLLVSGGFTYFAHAVQARLGIDAVRANELEIVDGQLTGRVLMQSWGDVVDGAEKRRALHAFAAEHGCGPEAAIVVGDGANDLLMMEGAGLSVAYHAKPAVRERAMLSIQTGGLDRILEVFAN